jgi:hypothetical protein
VVKGILEKMTDLARIDFGLGASQQEKHLSQFFYRSGAFEQATSDRIFLILGSKGAGKSAIFRMLKELHDEIPIFKPPNLWIADEPRLRDHNAVLGTMSNSKVALWRFYIASLLARQVVETDDSPEDLSSVCGRFLARWGLVREVPTAWQSLMSAKLSIGLGNYIKTEFPPKAPLATTEIDAVIYAVNDWLVSAKREVWVCLDSLDEVSLNGDHGDELEELLSSLMRAVGELIRLDALHFKLFFRTDLYSALTYVNKDHFSSVKLELHWSREDLAILLGHRLAVLHEDEASRIKYQMAIDWINAVFEWMPDAVSSFDDLYVKLQDGNSDVLPRDLVNFCVGAQKAQQNYDVQGVNMPAAGCLISQAAVGHAIVQTAASKLTDFLQVFQSFSKTYDRLKGHDTRVFDRIELGKALGLNDSLNAQIAIADLVRVGAIAVKDRKSVYHSNSFEIPYMYAMALGIGGQNG